MRPFNIYEEALHDQDINCIDLLTMFYILKKLSENFKDYSLRYNMDENKNIYIYDGDDKLLTIELINKKLYVSTEWLTCEDWFITGVTLVDNSYIEVINKLTDLLNKIIPIVAWRIGD